MSPQMQLREYFDISCAALCAWREARGEGADGMRAVLHVINNRAKHKKKSWAEIVFEPLQFSSMTFSKDPQLSKAPPQNDISILRALAFAESVYTQQNEDITEGATHYFNPTIVLPQWALSMIKIKTIGQHDFYKEA